MNDCFERFTDEVYKVDSSLYYKLPKYSFIFAAHRKNIDDGNNSSDDSDNGSFRKKDNMTFMKEFMDNIGVIKAAMTSIQRSTEELKAQRELLVTSFNKEMEEEIRDHVAKINHDQNKAVKAVQLVLEAMDGDIKIFNEENPNSAEGRIRANLHTFISKKFGDVLLTFHKVQSDYLQEEKSRMRRQIQMVIPEMDADEIAMRIERGEIHGVQELVQARLQGGVHANMQNALADIQMKYSDVVQLAKNTAELKQMVEDLSLLVDAQGDMLDSIEYNVTEAQEFLDKGQKNLVQARKTQKKKAKCYTICAAVAGVIVAIIIILIIFI